MLLLPLLLALQSGEINVAAASNGGSVFADSEYLGSPDDNGGSAPAAKLIDGVIRQTTDKPGFNRWHSDLAKPHPHWAMFKFAGQVRIDKLVLWRADVGAPVDIAGQWSPDHGQTIHQIFARSGLTLSEAHPSVAISFPAVTTDNFRLLITRSSNMEFPNYTQLSEVQVFGRFTGKGSPKPVINRVLGHLWSKPMPAGLKLTNRPDACEYVSKWIKVVFPVDHPGISFLSVDGRGLGDHSRNFLKEPRGIDFIETAWDEHLAPDNVGFHVSQEGNVVRYSGIGRGNLSLGTLKFTVEPKALRIEVDGGASSPLQGSPLRALFDVGKVVTTPLGPVDKPGVLEFPLLLHFVDHGTMVVTAKYGSRQISHPLSPPSEAIHSEVWGAKPVWRFTGNRQGRTIELALDNQPAGSRTVLDMRLTDVYPEKALVDKDPKLAGLRRGWLNMFGFRPDLPCLSNNVVSDNAIFCMYEYADHALYTPPLFDNFTALDLVGRSLDYYFDGGFGYGGDAAVFQDTDPAMVISAWDYATGGIHGKPRLDWLKRRIKNIEKYANHIVECDRNGDGLADAKRTGNSGSGIKGAGEWASNWWDVISFGGNDAYTIALDYRAFRCMWDLERRLGHAHTAELFASRAQRIKDVYYTTFYNPKTGVLAGWRSRDGQLHDYYFLFVNGIAISYGLVTEEQGNAIMDRLLAKMRDVGYTNFKIGLPGNLIPVARKDYAGGGVMGQPQKDDGSDSFQSYENGGATGGFAYFTLQALYTLGRRAEADRIFNAMLEGYRDGVFQDGVGTGVDWKRWDGTPCGYEGLLTDSYYALGAYITGKLGRGVPIP